MTEEQKKQLEETLRQMQQEQDKKRTELFEKENVNVKK